jgi:PKD repeat protein
VTDNYFFDVGNILSWSIAVQYGDMYAVTDSTGAYNLSNLPPGPYAIYEVTQNQYYQTVPAQGAPYNVTLASGQTFSNLDFGNRLTVGRPMLLPATDSGRYSDDRITNFDNSSDSKKLMFRVPGTTPGATVTIYANGRAIGSAIAPADSTSTDVTTDGDYRLTPDGVFHIQANQTDAGGQTGLSVPLDITIDTTPPVMGVDSLRTADTSPPLSGTVDDPNATIVVIVNGHSYDAVNHGDGTWSLAGNTLFPPLVGGIYDVRAEGTDIAGNTGHDTTTGELILSVTISSVTGPAHTDEGTVVTFTCQAADPDGSTISYTWNFNDGTPPQTLIGVNTIQHAFPDDGAFTINVQATIPNGQMDRGSTSIAVANVAPTIRSLATQAEFLRGQQGQIVADVFDPGTQDSLTYAWDFGDGSDPVSGISLASPHHTYAEAGRYAVTLTVTDEDHGWDRLTQTFPVWSKVVTPTAGQPLDFMDCDLNHVHVTITGGGSAQAYFLADTAADLGRLVISNSTSRTVVNISSTGAATTSVGDVIVDRTVAAIIAPNVELTGTIRVPQRAPLIQFGNVESGAQINIGAVLSAQNIIPGDGVSLRLGSIQDLSIDTHHLPIRSLTAVQWLNTDDTPDSLQAAWIGALRMLGTPAAGTGDFQADVTLSGDNLPAGALAVGSVYIRGSLEDSTWQIAGPAASVTVGGNMTHAAIDITCDEDVAIALGRLSVTGLMSDSEVRSTGDIGSAVVGAMHDSRIFAGVAENVTGLPQPSPDIFLPGSQAGHAAQIGSVIVRGMAQQGQYYSFVNSSIAAYRVGNVVMTQADFFSQGAPFGVAAWQAGSISYTDRNPRLNWKWSGQASQVINTNANMTVRLGVNDLASFRPGELLGRGRIGNGGSTRTNLTSVYLRAVGDWVYIGIGTLRPLTYSGLRVRILLDTLNGTDHLLYANDRRSDMMVELNLDTSAISLYEGGFAVPDPTLPVPAWVDLWHPQRWMSLPTMSSSVVTTPNGLILRLPKAALGPLDHLSLTCASLWTAAGATVDTVYC